MYLTVLKAVMAKRDLNQADIARASGVSRQAVSLWFSSDGEQDAYTQDTFGDIVRRIRTL